ncbi:murein biosynthesis integral membrane protein MurJ [Candidatus Enterovibrio escicola]|uniref:Probable lipid II flippase MurJ n=1 Tax=Candidatus Enterovibrio escicola TaxID=1927127 RepID=A0A2A5T5Z8_9GAMM|nr:murein biosynthesis integral membrane protein MurJ [Candidatus Enterovibrio escacola]PCS23563.1 putative peptidoglycan lipid II flippase MurJ [Candidatus Enterovibrio escacola]
MSKQLLRSGIVVSCMTMVSRIMGLVRDVVIANLLGAGATADVFFFANKIPNFLRRLFAEGAFSQAFVPVLSEYQASEDKNKTRELIAYVSGTLGVLVTLVTLMGVIASPVIAALFGAGWFIDWVNEGSSAYKFELASLILKITFPYLWFISFVALSCSILNTLGRFAVSSFTPVFLNVGMISAAIWIAPNLEQPEIGLGIGVFLGGMTQFAFQLPFLYREGMLVRPKWGWMHPAVVKIRTLMIPALFGVSVSQVNLLFDTFIASFLSTGSISWLYYSDRLLEFPLGLFGITIATVILPTLSKRHIEQSVEQFTNTMDWGIRMVFLLGLPAMVGILLLAKPLLMVLFMRGEFREADVDAVSLSLMAYTSGLLSFMLIKVLASGYFARQDTKSPVRYGIIAMVTNIMLNPICALFYGYIGLATSTSVSALVNAALLYQGLHNQGVYRMRKETIIFTVRLMFGSVLMGCLLYWWMPTNTEWLSMGLRGREQICAGLIGAGIITYFVSLLILGVRPHQLRTNG